MNCYIDLGGNSSIENYFPWWELLQNLQMISNFLFKYLTLIKFFEILIQKLLAGYNHQLFITNVLQVLVNAM